MASALAGLVERWRTALGAVFGPRARTADNLPRWLGGRIVIDRPPADVYAFWRRPSNLVMVFRILQAVEVHVGGGSHWWLRGRNGESLDWECEPVIDEPDAHLEWRAVADAPLHNTLNVRFTPSGEGTELVVEWTMSLRGTPGEGVTLDAFVDDGAQRMLDDDLRRLKTSLEIEGLRLAAEAAAPVDEVAFSCEECDVKEEHEHEPVDRP